MADLRTSVNSILANTRTHLSWSQWLSALIHHVNSIGCAANQGGAIGGTHPALCASIDSRKTRLMGNAPAREKGHFARACASLWKMSGSEMSHFVSSKKLHISGVI